ncbi:MAG: alpha/beta fold hydrolase [Hyphomicrobiaceae bacterium]
MTEDDLFPGFATERIDTGPGGVVIHMRIGGKGPALLLLHGYPQTHVAWHRLAPVLAEQFTVVAPDLRGYGQTGFPRETPSHRSYSKRAMADDMARLMLLLGHRRFGVMGHDRGARVAYRLAIDRPELVSRLAVIDVMTTWNQWQPDQQTTRKRIYHWAFLAQPAPIPETLIGASPSDWVDGRFKRGTLAGSLDCIDPRALAAYRNALSDPDRIHATCEDYRAGAGCDLIDDQADLLDSRHIACPTLLVWATAGSLMHVADPLALWRPWCSNLAGTQVVSGHYVPEENPAALLEAAKPFFAEMEASP